MASHPVWVRGLKQCKRIIIAKWSLSHPVWVRGLKLVIAFALAAAVGVAPRVGAWIETSSHLGSDMGDWVAPRVGAWIETLCY